MLKKQHVFPPVAKMYPETALPCPSQPATGAFFALLDDDAGQVRGGPRVPGAVGEDRQRVARAAVGAGQREGELVLALLGCLENPKSNTFSLPPTKEMEP